MQAAKPPRAALGEWASEISWMCVSDNIGPLSAGGNFRKFVRLPNESKASELAVESIWYGTHIGMLHGFLYIFPSRQESATFISSISRPAGGENAECLKSCHMGASASCLGCNLHVHQRVHLFGGLGATLRLRRLKTDQGHWPLCGVGLLVNESIDKIQIKSALYRATSVWVESFGFASALQ